MLCSSRFESQGSLILFLEATYLHLLICPENLEKELHQIVPILLNDGLSFFMAKFYYFVSDLLSIVTPAWCLGLGTDRLF